MLIEKTLYSLNDITIIPAVSTKIKSRSECIPFCDGLEGQSYYYPLIAAPMDSVVTTDNYTEYHNRGISCIIPRTISFDLRVQMMEKCFCAFSLKEILHILDGSLYIPKKQYILIDIANGMMLDQINIGKELKYRFGDSLTLMGGNIGNPNTYVLYDQAGFDFVRVGIGDGAGCLTSKQLGVSYPYASLINEIVDLRNRLDHPHCKIIADGGMSNYSDIIKCLALGADYVMCGMIFAKAAKKSDFEKVGDSFVYRGMSTKSAQKDMGNTNLKTAEGRILQLTKEYTLSGWIENFDSYLKSAMSYCDCHTLNEFKTKPICQVISSNASYKINNK